MSMILNMLGFCIYHGSKYAKAAQGLKYAWIIPGYAWLWPNAPKFVWIAFVLHFPIIIPNQNES